jgi:alkaline phosphatase D
MSPGLSEYNVRQPVEPFESTDDARFEGDSDGDPESVFPQSIASGGPTPRGVILWTRLDPRHC